MAWYRKSMHISFTHGTLNFSCQLKQAFCYSSFVSQIFPTFDIWVPKYQRKQPRPCFSGWWFEPLWKIWVSWDDYSQCMAKNVPNHRLGLVAGCCFVVGQEGTGCINQSLGAWPPRPRSCLVLRDSKWSSKDNVAEKGTYMYMCVLYLYIYIISGRVAFWILIRTYPIAFSKEGIDKDLDSSDMGKRPQKTVFGKCGARPLERRERS